MRYSQGFKESIIRKMLLPEDSNVTYVSREKGVATWTLYPWKIAVREGNMDSSNGELCPGRQSSATPELAATGPN